MINNNKRRFFKYPRRKVCYFCSNNMTEIDYKNIEILSKYIMERGKIMGRKATATCAKHQRFLTQAIKRARFMALLPFTENRKLKG